MAAAAKRSLTRNSVAILLLTDSVQTYADVFADFVADMLMFIVLTFC